MNYLGGDWVSGSGSEFESTNPATGEVIWSGNNSTDADVNAAISAARDVGRNWSCKSLNDRIKILSDFKDRLTDNKEKLATAISREVGKPLWEARTEVQAMIGKIAVSIEAIHDRRSDFAIDLPGGQGITRYKPHGVLIVFGPYNFPGHISNGHLVPALLAGNTVVFKPSELTPQVAELTVQLWEESGLPGGVLNLVQGGRETGIALVNHPEHNGVLFTGSLKAGLSISRALIDRPEAIVALELGGNNPLVVHDVPNVEAAVYTAIQSAYLTSGQRCTCARRLIVTDGNEEFLDRLVSTVPKLLIGMPDADPAPFMGPLIHNKAVQNVLDEQARLLKAGAMPLVKAKQMGLGDAFVSPGMIDVTNVSDRKDDEVFGPLLQLIRVPTLEAAIEESNRTRYGLVAGLISETHDDFEQFYRGVNAGLINWNSPTTGASGKLPFGGTGWSGNHRPAGYFMIDSCNVPVASIERNSLELPDALLPGIDLS